MGLLDAFRAKRYMDQRVFEFAAASIARLHLLAGADIDYCASGLARSYQRSYCAAEANALPRDWSAVVTSMLQGAQHALKSADREPTPELQAELFRHFGWYAFNFERNGTPKPQKTLNGTVFNQADFTPGRVAHGAMDFAVYAIALVFGQAPAAPADWSC